MQTSKGLGYQPPDYDLAGFYRGGYYKYTPKGESLGPMPTRRYPMKEKPSGLRVALMPAAAMVLFLGFVSVSGKEAVKDDSATARKAVQAILDGQAAAWNKGDLEGFMTGYWKSPDLMFFSGKDRTRGWQATIERYRKKYQMGGAKMGKLTFSDVEIEMVGPASAWVRGSWQVVRDKETLSGLFTLIFKKMPEGWRIVHDHTSAG